MFWGDAVISINFPPSDTLFYVTSIKIIKHVMNFLKNFASSFPPLNSPFWVRTGAPELRDPASVSACASVDIVVVFYLLLHANSHKKSEINLKTWRSLENFLEVMRRLCGFGSLQQLGASWWGSKKRFDCYKPRNEWSFDWILGFSGSLSDFNQSEMKTKQNHPPLWHSDKQKQSSSVCQYYKMQFAKVLFSRSSLSFKGSFKSSKPNFLFSKNSLKHQVIVTRKMSKTSVCIVGSGNW
jgi:hypothetical protein